jgi:hypothetical protein
VASTREIKNAYRSLIGKPKGKRRPGRHRCRYEKDTKY